MISLFNQCDKLLYHSQEQGDNGRRSERVHQMMLAAMQSKVSGEPR